MNNKIVKLEALRGFAAVYVLFHHFRVGEGTATAYFTMQGQVAVILFFILSGFVIFYSCVKTAKLSFRAYFIKRFRRIYGVFLAALLVSYLAACIDARRWMPLNLGSLVLNLTNLQDLDRHPGCWFEGYYGNTPLWSISYEWWFYMLFYPLYRYVPEDRQRAVAVGISLFGLFSYEVFPNQVSIILEYFLCWWTGVEIAKVWLKGEPLGLYRLRHIQYCLLAMIALLSVRVLVKGWSSVGEHPVIELRHYVYCYLLLVCGLIWRRMGWRFFNRTLLPFAAIAPISYAIYVLHYPVVVKYTFSALKNPAFNLALLLFVLCLLAYIVEVQGQKVINRWTDRFLRRPA
ncbi:MAG: acyltransferase [Verrucomicrobia bacterium]|nr:acyltransferase [Verrucomicrobiota bacterium]